MKSTLIARCLVLVFALLLTACSKDVALSSQDSAQATDQSGEDASGGTSGEGSLDAGDGVDAEDAVEVEPEEELTEAEKAALAAEEAAALVIRKSFDELVFGCGLDRDFAQCVQLREVLDVDAADELVERCDILDQVACGALANTVIADLQVQCAYEGVEESCQTLDQSWDLGAEANYGLGNSMTQAPNEALEADCLVGGVVECAELSSRG